MKLTNGEQADPVTKPCVTADTQILIVAPGKSAANQMIYDRPFNTYGPRQSARAVIPTIITQIAQGQRRIKLGKVSPTRDFYYVKDTVRGFIKIAESEQTVGEVINIGSNFEISIEDTARTIAETMRVEIDIITDEIRFLPDKSEVERLWADNTKARRLAGWIPEYGGLDGFKRAR